MKREALAFMRECAVATMATIASDGSPHLAVVFMHVDDDFNSFCLTRASTRKFQNIKQDSRVALSFSIPEKLLMCEVVGNAYHVSLGEEVMLAVAQLQEKMTHHHGEHIVPPVSQLDDSEYVVIKTVPRSIEFSDYSRSAKQGGSPYRVSFKP